MNQTKKKKGCLYYIMWFFFIRFIAPIGFLLFFGVLGAISELISSSWSDEINTTSNTTIKPKTTQETITVTKPKSKSVTSQKPISDDEKYFEKNTYWTTNFGPKHRGLVKVKQRDYYASINNRRNLTVYNTWKYNALSVIRNDKYKLDDVTSVFKRIKRDKNYSRNQFADVIVSFTQDIPYALIDNAIDIYAPVEFIKKYKGDCDTKTIFLYVVLKKFGYDVVILNSWHYGHSILGINLPTSGNNYKYYNGKRYYAWETTYPGWLKGQIPPKVFNMNHWEISLY